METKNGSVVLNKVGDRRGMHLYKHGKSRTPEHKIWCKMKERCSNPRSINYERYGGRGIVVCAEWSASFDAFFRDMGPRPAVDCTIERIDNLKGYFKDNCKWATLVEQANNKRNNRVVSFHGISKSVASWCRELGLKYHLVRQRIYRDHWTPERAFQQ